MRKEPRRLFHAHVTISNTQFNIPKGWKMTEILLEGSKVQTDIMLTKHYSLDHRVDSLEEIIRDCALLKSTLDVKRVKVECTSLESFVPVSAENYLEIHCRVKGTCEFGANWVRSKNPIKPDTYFWNARVYSGDVHGIIEKMTSEAYTSCAVHNIGATAGTRATILELKVEQVIFDSNRSHDSWWA